MKNVLFSYGFAYVSLVQGICNEVSFSQRVFDISHKDWVAQVTTK